MHKFMRIKNCFTAILIIIAGILLFAARPASSFDISIKNIIDATAHGSSDPSGLTYFPGTESLLLSDSDVNEIPFFAVFNMFELDLPLNLLGRYSSLGFSHEPTGVTYNTVTGTVFVSDDDDLMVYELDASTLVDVLSSFSTSAFGSVDPEGIGFDPYTGNLFIAGGMQDTIYEVTVSGTLVSSLVLNGITDPEGIYYDPGSGHFFLVFGAYLYELSTSGEVIDFEWLRPYGVHTLKGITFAPSSYSGDDPGNMHIYLADYGVDQVNDGKLFEISINGPDPANTPPQIDSGPTATPGLISNNETSQINVQASDVNSDILSYYWSISSGNGTISGSGDTVTYIPPVVSSSQTFTIDLSVFDLRGGKATGSVNVTVSSSEHTLIVTRTGNGSGTVTSNPAGIDCGADCTEVYINGMEVTLTATPDAGSVFGGWSGDSDCLDGTVTMDASTTCNAEFNLYSLSITKSGSGAGTVMSAPVGIICGADCSEDYDIGTEVTLTAAPDTGSYFNGWGGDPDCSDGIVTMNAAKTCDAMFNLYPLSITKLGNGGGTVTSEPVGIDCGADCTEDYQFGTVVTLTATPDTG
jgi:hypothetical protein